VTALRHAITAWAAQSARSRIDTRNWLRTGMGCAAWRRGNAEDAQAMCAAIRLLRAAEKPRKAIRRR